MKEKFEKLEKFLLQMGIAFLVLLIFLLLPILINGFVLTAGLISNEVIRSLFANSATFLLLVIIFRKTIVKDFKDFKKNYKSYLKTALKYWAIGLGVMMLSNLLINLFVFENTISGNEQAVRKIFVQYPIYGFISACLIAPFTEELTFRLGFRRMFKKMIPFALASTFVFAGLHVITDFKSPLDLLYFVPYGALGFAFAVTYFKTKNIFSSIAMHMFHNTITYLLLIITLLGA